MTTPLERAFSLETALSFLSNDLKQLGLSVETRTVGVHVQSTKCTLRGVDGEDIDFGYGKGSTESCLVGASFEAVEHYFSQPDQINSSVLEFVEIAEFLKSTPLKIIRALETLTIIPDATLPFLRYRGLNTDQETLYPLALMCPKYLDSLHDNPDVRNDNKLNYKTLERYSTNSGIAIGCSEEEAIIHGLLESVERDTLSRFLVSNFLFPDQSKIRLIDVDTLPEQAAQVLANVSAELQGEILLIEMPNIFGIPVFFSSLSNSPFPIDVAGFGASLSRDHAILRSLYELAQCFHVTAAFHPESVKTRDEQVLSNFSDHPFHRRCAGLKISEHCRKYGHEIIAFSETPDPDYTGSTTQYLERLLRIFQTNGVFAYSTKLASLPSGITVSHSFIDGQDHFFCVTEGSLVFPNEVRKTILRQPKSA